jgi:hypothetical protein
MSRMQAMIYLLALLIAAASFSPAITIHVPANQPTIQAGINAANNGDTVLVAPGTYVENINFMGKAITVKSSNGPKVTIIDGNANGPVVGFNTSEGPNSVLSGFTLQNGSASLSFHYFGGGVAISSASPTIKLNVIKSNTATDGGGVGVYFGSPIITGNTITGNSAQGGGGGIDLGGIGNGQIIHNTITLNSATFGAGVQLYSAGNALVEDNKILNNGGAIQGGGLYIVNESDEVIVQNLIATNNAQSGSQIYSSVPQSTTGYVLVNNTIISAPKGGADAAVIADGYNTNVVIENNIISAVGDNAAILCNPVYKDGPPIVQFNDAFNRFVSYGDSCVGFDGANGNISAKPLFGTSGYELSATSPAINAGSNAAPDLPTTDLAGQSRIVNGTIDMGAFEFQ